MIKQVSTGFVRTRTVELTPEQITEARSNIDKRQGDYILLDIIPVYEKD